MKRLCICSALYCLLVCTAAFSTETRTYRVVSVNSDSGEPAYFSETIEPSKSGLVITAPNCRILADTAYHTREFSYQDKKMTISASFDDGVLTIKSCVVGRKPATTKKKPDSAVWVQEQYLFLENFVRSTETTCRFFSIRTDNAACYDFEGTKQGTETINIDGKELKAMHVKLSLTGFLAGFWKADFWFDAETGRFLRYRAPHSAAGAVNIIESANGGIQ